MARSVLVLVLVFVGFGVPPVLPPAGAHQVEDLDVDTLTRRASIIVEGDVTGVESRWDAAGQRIYTTVRLQVDRYHKGGDGRSELFIRSLGGTVGEIRMGIIGQPEFELDERVLLFLQSGHEHRELPLVAGDQGKFLVRTDPATGRESFESPRIRVPRADAVGRFRALRPPR